MTKLLRTRLVASRAAAFRPPTLRVKSQRAAAHFLSATFRQLHPSAQGCKNSPALSPDRRKDNRCQTTLYPATGRRWHGETTPAVVRRDIPKCRRKHFSCASRHPTVPLSTASRGARQ